MREPVERAYFAACRALGWLLRSARYATVTVVHEGGARRVRKRRGPHAPLLLWMAGPLMRVLGTGVRVLPQRAWEARERELHMRLRGASVAVDADGTLVLPFLTGETLATLLEDATLAEPDRTRAIECAAIALAALHRQGVTHGDAMAENVMVDRAAGGADRVAHWFDFETAHDPRRPLAWRRADDLRALLTTCLLRTAPGQRAATLARILDAYADQEVARVLAASVAPVLRRPLAFHLGQAALSFEAHREVARLLRARPGA